MKSRIRRNGSVLVAVLWCLALLSIIVVGALHSTTLNLNSAKNFEDKIQAHYLAVAGIEKAKALLYHEAAARQKAGRNHSGELYNSEVNFKGIELGRGRFSVIRQGSRDEGGSIVFGVSDEESRLNINSVTPQDFAKIRDMPPEIAAAIIDWRDRDNNANPGGVERDYYATLKPPYLPRNGEIQTIREMLLIRGVTPALLLGEDLNGNRLLDPEENDGEQSSPSDNRNNILEAGWAELFCVKSSVANKDAAGEFRVNVQTASEAELQGIRGVTPELAKAIVEWRTQNQFENIADLLEVSALAPPQPTRPGQSRSAQPQSTPQPAPNRPGQPQQQGQQPQPRQPVGPKLISQELLIDIGDNITIERGSTLNGVVNINTASFQVLTSMNGMTDEVARAIVNHRQSTGYFPNVVSVLNVPGMTREMFRQISKRITARSETFRIVSEGRVTFTGARERIEAVIRMSGRIVETVSYRENL